MTEYEYLMEKKASTVKQDASAVRDALNAYKANANKDTLAALTSSLRALRGNNPTHLNTGYWRNARDTKSRAKEMMARGNTVRGALGYAGVPLAGLYDVSLAPGRFLGRLFGKGNVAADSVGSLSRRNPGDVQHNVRAAEELLRTYSGKRADPTGQMELTRNLMRNLKANPAQTTGELVDRGAAFLAGNVAATPGVAEVTSDVMSAPHTALLNALGWNGTSRAAYEKAVAQKHNK